MIEGSSPDNWEVANVYLMDCVGIMVELGGTIRKELAFECF